MSLQALRAEREKKVAEMRQMVNTAEAEERDLNEEEAGKFDALQADVEKMDASISRLESLAGMEAALDEPADSRIAGVRGHPGRAAAAAPKEFESFGEFLHAVRFNDGDTRLSGLYGEMQAADGQRMSEGASGGFMVPDQFMSGIMQVDPEAAIVRPRARVIPAGNMPDASLSLTALDQGSASNMYGGVEVYSVEEGGTKQDTEAKLRNVQLTPQEVAACVEVTDKLLRNWPAASIFISDLLRDAIRAWEDRQFLTGNGVGKPLGILNSPAVISVARAAANDITYVDIVNMEAELLEGGVPVWVISKKAKKRLRHMKDEAGHLIWQDSARTGEPPLLLGIPVFTTTRTVALGTKGDIMLADLKSYLIKDGSGIFVQASEHVKFKQNKTVIKAFWNVDGAPWLNGPVKADDGELYSAFVVLDVPSGSP
jgi:HK97 family phage major capsid protein